MNILKSVCLATTLLSCPNIPAQNTRNVYYQKSDSTKVLRLINDMNKLKRTDEKIFCAAFEMQGAPYGGIGVRTPGEECLVVNFQKMDCITYVENVLALVWAQNKETKNPSNNPFATFCNSLQNLRYRNGNLTDYTSRLHYITQWIADPAKNSLIYEAGGPSFTARQKIDIHYMSSHLKEYPELRRNVNFQKIIRNQEKQASGKTIFYIPKASLKGSQQELGIKNGDIIAFVTSKDGLDCSHIGFAIWIDGKLHLMHASSYRKKVLIDNRSLYEYMLNKRQQLGIRIFRLKI